MQRSVKEGLGLKCFKRTSRMTLDKAEEKTLACEESQDLVKKPKRNPRDVIILFSEETPSFLREIEAANGPKAQAGARCIADEDFKFLRKIRRYGCIQSFAEIASHNKKMPQVFLEYKERLHTD